MKAYMPILFFLQIDKKSTKLTRPVPPNEAHPNRLKLMNLGDILFAGGRRKK